MAVDYEYLCQLFVSCLEADYRQVENGGSFAAVRDGDLLYLFFEKSNGAVDWINNLSYRAVPRGREGDKWFCHEGFLRVFEAVLPYFKDLIFNPSVRKIVTVGYSHGAALALLCHEYIWFSRSDIIGESRGYGFGCPRVIFGTVPREGERWNNFLVIRNIDDIVTHLPPRAFGYRHVGRLLEIGRSGKYSGSDAHRDENYIIEMQNALKRTNRLDKI